MTQIPEEKLNIPGDYQYRAIQSKNIFLSNWHNNKMIAVKSLINNENTKNLLDIVSGSGIFAYLYAKEFDSITTVDYHEKATKFVAKMIRQNNIHNVTVKKLNIKEISKLNPNNKYDTVLLLDVIEHIDDITVVSLLSYIKNFLTRDGIFIVTTPNYKGLWPCLETIVEKFGLVPKISGVQHINLYNKKLLLQIFSDLGYQNIFFSTINTYSFLFPIKSVARKLIGLEMKYPLPFGNLLIAAFKVNTS